MEQPTDSKQAYQLYLTKVQKAEDTTQQYQTRLNEIQTDFEETKKTGERKINKANKIIQSARKGQPLRRVAKLNIKNLGIQGYEKATQELQQKYNLTKEEAEKVTKQLQKEADQAYKDYEKAYEQEQAFYQTNPYYSDEPIIIDKLHNVETAVKVADVDEKGWGHVEVYHRTNRNGMTSPWNYQHTSYAYIPNVFGPQTIDIANLDKATITGLKNAGKLTTEQYYDAISYKGKQQKYEQALADYNKQLQDYRNEIEIYNKQVKEAQLNAFKDAYEKYQKEEAQQRINTLKNALGIGTQTTGQETIQQLPIQTIGDIHATINRTWEEYDPQKEFWKWRTLTTGPPSEKSPNAYLMDYKATTPEPFIPFKGTILTPISDIAGQELSISIPFPKGAVEPINLMSHQTGSMLGLPIDIGRDIIGDKLNNTQLLEDNTRYMQNINKQLDPIREDYKQRIEQEYDSGKKEQLNKELNTKLQEKYDEIRVPTAYQTWGPIIYPARKILEGAEGVIRDPKWILNPTYALGIDTVATGGENFVGLVSEATKDPIGVGAQLYGAHKTIQGIRGLVPHKPGYEEGLRNIEERAPEYAKEAELIRKLAKGTEIKGSEPVIIDLTRLKGVKTKAQAKAILNFLLEQSKYQKLRISGSTISDATTPGGIIRRPADLEIYAENPTLLKTKAIKDPGLKRAGLKLTNGKLELNKQKTLDIQPLSQLEANIQASGLSLLPWEKYIKAQLSTGIKTTTGNLGNAIYEKAWNIAKERPGTYIGGSGAIRVQAKGFRGINDLEVYTIRANALEIARDIARQIKGSEIVEGASKTRAKVKIGTKEIDIIKRPNTKANTEIIDKGKYRVRDIEEILRDKREIARRNLELGEVWKTEKALKDLAELKKLLYKTEGTIEAINPKAQLMRKAIGAFEESTKGTLRYSKDIPATLQGILLNTRANYALETNPVLKAYWKFRAEKTLNMLKNWDRGLLAEKLQPTPNRRITQPELFKKEYFLNEKGYYNPARTIKGKPEYYLTTIPNTETYNPANITPEEAYYLNKINQTQEPSGYYQGQAKPNETYYTQPQEPGEPPYAPTEPIPIERYNITAYPEPSYAPPYEPRDLKTGFEPLPLEWEPLTDGKTAGQISLKKGKKDQGYSALTIQNGREIKDALIYDTKEKAINRLMHIIDEQPVTQGTITIQTGEPNAREQYNINPKKFYVNKKSGRVIEKIGAWWDKPGEKKWYNLLKAHKRYETR